MEETECLICNCDICDNYESNIMIAQECNCIYKVHDNCMINWCKVKSKCLICHKPIKLYTIKKHKPFRNQQRRENNYQSEQQHIPPRMSFFKKLFRCCIP